MYRRRYLKILQERLRKCKINLDLIPCGKQSVCYVYIMYNMQTHDL